MIFRIQPPIFAQIAKRFAASSKKPPVSVLAPKTKASNDSSAAATPQSQQNPTLCLVRCRAIPRSADMTMIVTAASQCSRPCLNSAGFRLQGEEHDLCYFLRTDVNQHFEHHGIVRHCGTSGPITHFKHLCVPTQDRLKTWTSPSQREQQRRQQRSRQPLCLGRTWTRSTAFARTLSRSEPVVKPGTTGYSYAKSMVRMIGRSTTFCTRLRRMTMPKHFYLRIAAGPTRSFVVYDKTPIKEGGVANEYLQEVGRLADEFRRRGIGNRTVVGMFINNSPEFVFVWWALFKIGAIPAPINTSISQEPFRHCLKISESQFLICSHELYDIAAASLGVGEKMGGSFQDARVPNMQEILLYDYGTYPMSDMHVARPAAAQTIVHEALPAPTRAMAAWPKDDRPRVGPTDTSQYLFTSGTTGLPKAATCKDHSSVFSDSSLMRAIMLTTYRALWSLDDGQQCSSLARHVQENSSHLLVHSNVPWWRNIRNAATNSRYWWMHRAGAQVLC